MKKFWILPCLLSLLLASCQSGAKEEKVEIPSDWQTIQGQGFSVKCPADWKLDTTKNEGVVFKILAPVDDAKDTFNEYAQLTVQNLDKKVGLKELSKNMTEMVNMTVGNFATVENKLYKDEMGQYQVLNGSGSLSIFLVTLENRTRIIDQKGYAMLSIYETSKAWKYRKTMKGIMQSLVIK